MVIIDGAAIRVTPPAAYFSVPATMRALKRQFGDPDLTAASAWIITVTQRGDDSTQMVILRPSLERTGFDPRAQPRRTAWWDLVTGHPNAQDFGRTVLAPVILAILTAGLAGDLTAAP